MTDQASRTLGRSFLSVLWWLAIVASTTALLWSLKPILDKAHLAMAFLLVVLAGSARHGRRLGIMLAVLCFLSFNFFFLPPYYTFIIADPLDWVVLGTFLITGGVAAHLLDRSQRETAAANRRAEEIDRLSVLGAETLNAGRAEEAVEAIAQVLGTTLDLSCEIYLCEGGPTSMRQIASFASPAASDGDEVEMLAERAVASGRVVLADMGGRTRCVGKPHQPIDAVVELGAEWRFIVVPLKVRDRVVGVLRLAHDHGIELDHAQARFTAVLSYYAALGVERVRLVAAEERTEALRHADRLKDALLASVSHDLRTPLTTIKALAHELADLGDERVHMIEEEADRMNRLVADLLDLSSLNAGAMQFKPEVVAAEDLIGAALQRIGSMLGRCDIAVKLPDDEVLPIGTFDFSQSLRILVNLLENAVKYGPDDHPVELIVHQDDEWLAFEVMDRGPGVSEDQVARIFEPFYRVETARPEAGGTGLGLAIARRLAEAQGGAVHYRPRSGGGSIFTLRLPAAQLEPSQLAG